MYDAIFNEPPVSAALMPAEVRRALHQAQDRASRHQATLDHLQVAVLVVDSSGRVLEHNAAAERLVSTGDGLVLRQGRLTAYRSDETARLLLLIVDATDAATRRGEGGGACRLSRTCGGAYAILVTPLAAGTASGADISAALILVTHSERRCRPSEDHLRTLYGLTPAEARLAAALCDGDGLVATAHRLVIAHETARQHLKRIMDKVGCRRQPDLLRVLLTGVLTIFK